ncbi:MAG: TAXI family TRAP transporter solute-binding subunit [Oscillospiraceae bacterium]|nr:TAXI family TRAP transporter solute-binding subunit [Oscillospiraceae bacterium]
MKRMLALVLSLLMVLSLAACGESKTPAPAAPADNTETTDSGKYVSEIRDMIFVTGPSTGPWGLAQASIVQAMEGAIDNLSITALEGGSIKNLKAIAAGDAQLGFTWTSLYGDSLTGQNAFEETGPLEGISTICATQLNNMFIVVNADSGVRYLEDLKTTNWNAGDIGGGLEFMIRTLFKYVGFDYDDIKASGGNVTFEPYSTAGELMKDGHIVGFAISADLRNATTMDLENSMKVDVVDMTGPAVDEFIEKNVGFSRGIMPSNTYNGQEGDRNIILSYSCLCCASSLSEDLVYEMTKAFYEARETVKDASPAFSFFCADPQNVLSGIDVSTLHPGAARYWREIGVLK